LPAKEGINVFSFFISYLLYFLASLTAADFWTQAAQNGDVKMRLIFFFFFHPD
jgi:hypothetical protein